MVNTNTPIKVLIVDDSALMRQLISAVLSEDPELKVVGTAPDPVIARERIKALNPDVLTLDVEMPRMDGVTFLRELMAVHPMPVVMLSTLTQAGAEVTLDALESGAVDFVGKPSVNVAHAIDELAEEIRMKVKAAGRMRVRPRPRRAEPRPAPKRRAGVFRSGGKIVAVGASTGGVEALKALLMDLPENCPPIVITQHMPPKFTTSFAIRLNNECPMKVYEAAHSQPIEEGSVYLAPGSHHLEITRAGDRFACRLTEEATVSGHRPSVDVLFRSVARAAGSRAIGVILTGMGKDGAEGLLELRQAGGYTLGQDEATALIYGMPRVAFERGAVIRQYPLGKMADAILEACAPHADSTARSMKSA